MNAAVAGLLAAIVLALSQAAAPVPAAPPANTERVEAGHLQVPGGPSISYRIRLLPLSSFPALPAAVAAQLAHRDCMIPQTYEAKQPENVIHGAFRAAGTTDWAALCSVRGTTTLYVFLAGNFDQPMAIRSQSDTAWLGADPGESVQGSAWGIAVRTAQELRSDPEFRQSPVIDHDAIDDAWLEHSLTVHYDQDGKWLEVTAGDNGI